MAKVISRVGDPLVEVNCNVERCVLGVFYLPGKKIRVLAPDKDVRPRRAMVE